MTVERQILIVGGGPAGFFAAITAAEAVRPPVQVTICEATAHPLAKVRVSGGGRCNVTNACLEPRDLVVHYPRGGRELLGPLHRFGPRETIEWFRARGVDLKAEADGRMFPVTDQSTTIVDCLQAAARAAQVNLRTRCAVRAVERTSGSFRVFLSSGEVIAAERVLLATGGGKSHDGFVLAESLGHTVVPPVPSLFTFHIIDPRLAGLAGVALERVVATVPGTTLRSEGPLLVTHEGLSGPAILRLSAWGARDFAAGNYGFTLKLNLTPPQTTEAVAEVLATLRRTQGRKQLATWCPFALPLRLWERLLASAGARPGLTWAELARDVVAALAREMTAAQFVVCGKSLNKDEFVTCGGVALREVDFRTMESRLCPGLFFAGEMLDLDGVTGGFNFQAAWTTGWHAGHGLARE